MMAIVKQEETSVTEKVQMMSLVIDILNHHQIDYWLEFGTLLGYVRDKNFIPWDKDIDIGIHNIEDILNIRQDFEKKGMTVKPRYLKTKDKTAIIKLFDRNIKSAHIDIYNFKKENEHDVFITTRRKNIITKLVYMMCLGSEKFDAQWTNKLRDYLDFIHVFFSQKHVFYYELIKTKEVKFFGVDVKIPEKATNHCILMYGKSWKVPRKGDIGGADMSNVTKNKTYFYHSYVEKEE